MKRTIQLAVACVAVIVATAGQGLAGIIDFDDLDSTSGTFIAQGYNGFSWLGAEGTGSWINNAITENSTGAHSGHNYAWSNGGSHLELSDGLFDVNSMWLRTRLDISSRDIWFSGSLGGTELYTHNQTITNQWSLITLNFDGIDKLNFNSSPVANIFVDDINFSRNAVPEPSTFALLGIGGIALVGYGWRRKRQQAA